MTRLAAFFTGSVVSAALLLAASAAYLRHAAHGFSAREQPSRMETMLAHTALHAAMAADMRNRANPVAPSVDALHEGMEHFADHCAVCHGNNGSGDTMLGNGMYPKPPDMRLSATQGKTDGELLSIIDNGVRMSAMPGFGGSGDADDPSWKLVLFIRHLPQLTRAEAQEMQQLNPKSPSDIEEEKQEEDFLNGAPAKP